MTTDSGLAEGVPAKMIYSVLPHQRGRRKRRKDPAAATVGAEPLEIPDGIDNAAEVAAGDKGLPKARDNAVTARLTKTKMCHFFERGKCASENCRYAHAPSELRQQPNLEKTKLCKSFVQNGYCNDGENCGFAHGETELRVTDGIYKTQMCHFFERGRCLKGERCNHAHGSEDLRFPTRSRQSAGAMSQGASSMGGVIGDPALGAVAMWGMNAPVGNGLPGMSNSVAAPMGLRSPLSPLPLAELLIGETGGNVNLASPEPPMSLGGIEASHLQSPDLFSMWSAWTPPNAFAGPLGLPIPPQAPAPPPNPLVGATPTPIASFQGLSPLNGAATAPPAALGPICSPAPGPSDPAVSGEGIGRGLLSSKAPGGDLGNSVVCDLSNRLASLDIACKDLQTETRNIRGVAGSPTGEPPCPSTPLTPADVRSERLVHRI